jgi:hypothetical protein
MASYELNASFGEADPAREAERKLQALRVTGITPGEDGMSFSAVVEDGIVDRAVQVIRQSGGTADWH